MKKTIRAIICLMLMSCMIFATVPMRAEADTQKYVYKTITPKQNTYFTTKGETDSYNYDTDTWTDTYYVYKITVPANGYVKFQTNSIENSIEVYKTINKNKYIGTSEPVCYFYDQKIYRCVMPKGTYYVYAEKGTKIKWAFVKSTNPTNYCRAKATKLTASKKVTVVFNRAYEFDRWYKIVLPKKKTITVYFNDLSKYEGANFYVYRSNGVRVKCPDLTTTSYRTAVLPKGTYYIRVMPGDNDSYEEVDYYGTICTLSWK